MALYKIFNGPMPTTAAQAVVTTGTAIKTMLQVKPGTTTPLWIVEWGISFDGTAAATPVKCELFESDVAATVTASVAADLTKYDAGAIAGGDPTTAIIAVGTAATGYTSSSEGTTTVARMFDVQLIAPTNQYVIQMPLSIWPMLQVSKFGRIRVTTTTAYNCYCYMLVSTAAQ